MQVIPIQAIPNQIFNIVLNEQNCTFHFYQKGAFLFMDLSVDGEDVRTGFICLCDSNLLQYPTPYFKGLLYFSDLEGKGTPPQYSELGTRFVLFYEVEE